MAAHRVAGSTAIVAGGVGIALVFGAVFAAQSATSLAPSYKVDPWWPKPLPNHWLVGAVAGVAVDSRDHVWITHRPVDAAAERDPVVWRAAPPVLEFDQEGQLRVVVGRARARATSGRSSSTASTSTRTTTSGSAGGGDKDAQILKFTRDRTRS